MSKTLELTSSYVVRLQGELKLKKEKLKYS